MCRHSLPLAVASLSLIAPVAWAGSIDFDDRPAANDPAQILSEEYADMGVHFTSGDEAATWSGMSGGDPGDWQLDGSNQPAFVGFDGTSYIAVVDFDEAVEGFQLDVARANGADWPDDFFMLAGYRDRAVVDVVVLHLGAVNAWQTVAMTVPVDRVVLQGVGVPGYRFGVDNFQWLGDEPEVIPLDVDVVPGSDANRVNIKSQGLLTVAVYGSEDLDVLDIDPGTLAFGPAGEGLAHSNGPHVDDLDSDGMLDLVLHFHTRSTGIGADDAEACLLALTWDGNPAEGCDAVHPND